MKATFWVIALAASAWAQELSSLGTSPAVARGDKLFAQGCAVGYCHGLAGSAARSPRLRGRSFERDYLVKVIRDGIPNTAMPAWGDRLTNDDIQALVAYIESLASAPAEAPAPVVNSSGPAIQIKANDVPQELQTGRELFFDPVRLSRCSNCHRMQGIGTPVSLDLNGLGEKLKADPAAILKQPKAGLVKTIAMVDGDRFPGIVVEKTNDVLRVWDLKGVPPVYRTLLASEVQSVQAAPDWRHAEVIKEYSPEDLVAVWGFVNWAAQPNK